MNVSLDHHHQSPVHTRSPNYSAPSTLPAISCGQTIVQEKEQRTSRKKFRLFQRTGEIRATAFSRVSQRPDEKRGAPQGRYSCSICELDYAQPQGLTRHQREKHKARLCMYCREFAWARPYLFREHLVKRHPGIDPNAAINEAIGTRRRATIRRRSLPQLVPIPTTERDGRGRAESKARSSLLTSSPSAEAKPTPVFPTDMSSLAYDSQPESTEPAIKEMRRHEDVRPLELLNAIDDDDTSSSMEERAQPETTLGMSARSVQIWLVMHMPFYTIYDL
jgi:hypothetical protein